MTSTTRPAEPQQSDEVSKNPLESKKGTVNIDGDVPDVSNQLPPKPNPELKSHDDFVHCMPPTIPTYRKYSLFLAGSIEMGRAIQWQKRMVDYLQDLPITVCNPRRGEWDVTTTPSEKDIAFNRQVQWELSALEHVSVICFFFDKNTISPVTMLELGLWAKSKKVVVCCDSGFHKAGNVHITCRRYGIDFVEKFEDLVPLVKKMLMEKGMKLNENNDLVDNEGNLVDNKGPVVEHINDIFTGIVIRKEEETPQTQQSRSTGDAVSQSTPPESEVKPVSEASTATKKSGRLSTLFGKLRTGS